MKKFCKHKLIKKIFKKSKQPLTLKFEQMEIISLPLFSNFLKKKTSAHHYIIFHCMIIEFVTLTKFVTVFLNNMKVPVYWRFF